MNESFIHLNQFITDLKLRQPNGIIIFNANIVYTINDVSKEIKTEVHIITSDHLASIYFLSTAINSAELPDLFDIKNSDFTYSENKSLKVKSANITVTIFPI